MDKPVITDSSLGAKFKWLSFAFILFVSIGVDQYTKVLAKNHLRGKPTIEVLGQFLVLKYAENDGAFLSMGSRLPPRLKVLLLTVFPLVVLLGMAIYIIKSEALNRGSWVAVCLILAGGISNLYDRIMYDGFVIDFLNMGVGGLRTGIFNVADMSITGGACYFLLIPLFTRKKNEEKSENSG